MSRTKKKTILPTDICKYITQETGVNKKDILAVFKSYSNMLLDFCKDNNLEITADDWLIPMPYIGHFFFKNYQYLVGPTIKFRLNRPLHQATKKAYKEIWEKQNHKDGDLDG